MTIVPDRTTRERVAAALPVALVHALIAWALLTSFDIVPPAERVRELRLIDLSPEAVPPPEPPEPPAASSRAPDRPARRADPREEGAAAPPNLESRATEIVAPRVEPLLPPPLPAAPVAGTGSDRSSGAAPVRGPGTGSGGIGTGTGSGRRGGGPGGGGGGGGGDGAGGLTPPRWLRGSLRNSDYPAGLGEAGIGGTVSVIYTVETDGRVADCAVTRSSGSAALDRTTCRLIEQRFRFDPSRDRDGRPVRSHIVENHSWIVEDLPPEPRQRPRRRRW